MLINDSIYLNTIALFEWLKIDYDDSKIFNNKMNSFKELYPDFYIIEEDETRKLRVHLKYSAKLCDSSV